MARIYRRKAFLDGLDLELREAEKFLQRQMDYCNGRGDEYRKLHYASDIQSEYHWDRMLYWNDWGHTCYKAYKKNRALWWRVHHLQNQIWKDELSERMRTYKKPKEYQQAA